MPPATAVTDAPFRRDWETFCSVNGRRRAIRHFDGLLIPDEVVRAVLQQAVLAPSSANMQPYELHWVRDADTRRRIAAACHGQRAAATASTLIVVTAGPHIAKRTVKAMEEYLRQSAALTQQSKAYHRAQLKTFAIFLRMGTLACWTPCQWLAALVWPALTLLPFGAAGIRHWAARSAIYAAQNLLLAASAHGLDSCPMEGFNAARVASILGLQRGTVVPIVIALGYRSPGARVEPRWRRPLDELVVVH